MLGDNLQRVVVKPNPHMRELGRYIPRDQKLEVSWADSLSIILGQVL